MNGLLCGKNMMKPLRTCSQIREIQEAVSESGRPDVEVILGGTTLLTPKDMFELLLGQYSYS